VPAAVVVVLLPVADHDPGPGRVQKTLMFTHSSRARAAIGMVLLGKP
jgi:hypothetical protein